MLLAYI